jgi:hypothetical protein
VARDSEIESPESGDPFQLDDEAHGLALMDQSKSPTGHTSK